MKQKHVFLKGRRTPIVIGSIIIALLLTAGACLMHLQANQVIQNQMAENHCILCDQLTFSEEDGTWSFNGTEEEFEEMYGEVGGRELMLDAIAGCPAGASVLQEIIDEYQATGSLDDFFEPLYSYIIPRSFDELVSDSFSTQAEISFDVMYASTHDTSEVDSTSGDIKTVKTHYTYEDLGVTYEEIYTRAVAYQEWLEGGSYPEGIGDPAMNNAELTCLRYGMIGAGIVKCVVVPTILLAPLFFGGAFVMRIVQILINHPELPEIVEPLWDLCVAVVSALRAGFGLPP